MARLGRKCRKATAVRNPNRRGGCLVFWPSNFVPGVVRDQTSVVPVVQQVVVLVVVVFVVILMVQVLVCGCMWWLVCRTVKSIVASKGP